MQYVFIAVAVLVVWYLAANLRVVSQSEAYVIEFLGKYKDTW